MLNKHVSPPRYFDTIINNTTIDYSDWLANSQSVHEIEVDKEIHTKAKKQQRKTHYLVN